MNAASIVPLFGLNPKLALSKKNTLLSFEFEPENLAEYFTWDDKRAP